MNVSHRYYGLPVGISQWLTNMKQTPGPNVSDDSIGEEIRELRKAKGLRLRDLALRADRSFSYLSQVERGKVQPSLMTLKNIADALAVDVGWFFPITGGTDDREYGLVVRAQTRRRLSSAYLRDSEALGFEDYLLSGSLGLNHYMGLSRISPGGSTNAEPRSYEAHICGYVAKGAVNLDIDDEVFILYEGDSFSFDLQKSHNISNESELMVEVVWSITPVRIPF